MTKEEKAIAYFEGLRKVLVEDFLKHLPEDSVGYNATLLEKEYYDTAIEALSNSKKLEDRPIMHYEVLWDKLYNWLNDMRFSIAPDETVTDAIERNDRLTRVDLLDEIMEWMVDQVPKAE